MYAILFIKCYAGNRSLSDSVLSKLMNWPFCEGPSWPSWWYLGMDDCAILPSIPPVTEISSAGSGIATDEGALHGIS